MQQITELQLRIENCDLKMQVLSLQVQFAQAVGPIVEKERADLVAKLDGEVKKAQEAAQKVADKGTLVAAPTDLPQE
jgi:uncharacterized protein YlaN (UPF0358 family)